MKKEIVSLGLAAFLLSGALVTPIHAITYEELEEQKNSAHAIAEEARKIGLEEDHEIIEQARLLWNDAQNKIDLGSYEKVEPTLNIVQYYSDADATMLGKLMFGEGRGIKSKTQLACICWTVLNRVDAGYGSISKVVTAPNQYHYSSSFSTKSDYGYDLKELAYDVLSRWNLEKNGLESSGRVLPKNYLFFHGNGKENVFRDAYSFNKAHFWNYSLSSPYEN